MIVNRLHMVLFFVNCFTCFIESVINAETPLTPGFECGKLEVEGSPNGLEANEGEFPWVVSIQLKEFEGKVYPMCSGAIINSRFILTAAHCMNYDVEINIPLDSLIVVAGRHDDTDEPNPNQQLCKLKIPIKHADYSGVDIYHNIALVEVDPPFAWTAHVSPICLPDSEISPIEVFDGRTMYVDGYIKDKPTPGNRRRAKLDVKNVKTCISDKNGGTHVCFLYDLEPTSEICTSHEGGALVDNDKISGIRTLFGIDVRAGGCKSTLAQGMFIQVCNYIPWILETLAANGIVVAFTEEPLETGAPTLPSSPELFSPPVPQMYESESPMEPPMKSSLSAPLLTRALTDSPVEENLDTNLLQLCHELWKHCPIPDELVEGKFVFDQEEFRLNPNVEVTNEIVQTLPNPEYAYLDLEKKQAETPFSFKLGDFLPLFQLLLKPFGSKSILVGDLPVDESTDFKFVWDTALQEPLLEFTFYPTVLEVPTMTLGEEQQLPPIEIDLLSLCDELWKHCPMPEQLMEGKLVFDQLEELHLDPHVEVSSESIPNLPNPDYVYLDLEKKETETPFSFKLGHFLQLFRRLLEPFDSKALLVGDLPVDEASDFKNVWDTALQESLLELTFYPTVLEEPTLPLAEAPSEIDLLSLCDELWKHCPIPEQLMEGKLVFDQLKEFHLDPHVEISDEIIQNLPNPDYVYLKLTKTETETPFSFKLGNFLQLFRRLLEPFDSKSLLVGDLPVDESSDFKNVWNTALQGLLLELTFCPTVLEEPTLFPAEAPSSTVQPKKEKILLIFDPETGTMKVLTLDEVRAMVQKKDEIAATPAKPSHDPTDSLVTDISSMNSNSKNTATSDTSITSEDPNGRSVDSSAGGIRSEEPVSEQAGSSADFINSTEPNDEPTDLTTGGVGSKEPNRVSSLVENQSSDEPNSAPPDLSAGRR